MVGLNETEANLERFNYQFAKRPEGEIHQITEQEFWSEFSTHMPEMISYNQIQGQDAKEFPNRDLKGNGSILGDTFYFWDFAIVTEFQYWTKERKTLFWKVAKCFHEDEEVSGKSIGRPQWNCYHYYKCKKCGRIREQDSSD